MSWTLVRDEVQTILSGVSGIGQVHSRIRSITNDRGLQAILVASNIINGWMHTRIGTAVERLTNYENIERHAWLMRGWYSFNDVGDSETTFQALIESIRAAFRDNVRLNDAAEFTEPVQFIENSEPHVMIPPGDGGKLCHFAELRMMIQERVVGS